MFPADGVSGLYFAPSESHDFAVYRISKDQVESYACHQAARLGRSLALPSIVASPRDTHAHEVTGVGGDGGGGGGTASGYVMTSVLLPFSLPVVVMT